jgi:DNA-binding transcriptional LysR family regulator
MTKAALDRRWLPLNALRAFEGVAKYSSFTAAANALLISQSALSRHVIRLEKFIGAQLFDRRPHALVLTKEGHDLLPVVTRAFDRLEYALEGLCKEGRSKFNKIRTLRVQMPPSFAVRVAVPVLSDFRHAAPDVQIDLLSPCEVGLPLIDVDLAVIYSKPRVTEMVTDLLWLEHFSLVCHSRVAAQYAGKSLAEFVKSNELLHVRVAELPRHHVWLKFARQVGLDPSSVERGLVFDTAVLAVQYALSGEGIVLADAGIFHEYLRDGSLVRPFEDTFDIGYGYYLITHPEALSDDAVATFRSWLIERFGSS